MSTYSNIKLAILQRIFAITGSTLVQNTNTTPYLNMMPDIINKGLNELRTKGKYKIKSHTITQDGTGAGLVQKYDFSTLLTDFYNFGTNKVYLDDGKEYKATLNYKTEANKIFVLPTSSIGTWTVYYNAYPTQITASTPDDTPIDLDPEVEELLILYTCSRVYLDDNAGFSTLWLNQYQDGLANLNPNADQPAVEFTHTYESW
jgi:hypothetical protein